ncbi:NifB/NifX family molybdenum-iron cluster-binding protein [Maribellus sediminis]|uniref:NifB/NifX family molybdenum-iron cluster-binding protein n=1 Tax=Maribellus sediminis TaxID=2696285 RepID=UPI0014311B52|nr:NifB/NifX family molybdenum-iron cluster-binding protein [Maribellus sediminis]
MRRVAIPILDNTLSEYFGGCNFYEIFEIEDGEVRKSSVEIPTVDAVDQLPQWLGERGITDVIVYKIKKEIIRLFASQKINLFVGIHQDTPENLIADYLHGNLESDEKIIQEITV